MNVRHGWLLGISLGLAATPACADAQAVNPPVATPPAVGGYTAKPPPRTQIAQAQQPVQHVTGSVPHSTATIDLSVPHTLAEALALTYSTQPALQAERAKLRSTDENVPTALAGWRPTVVLAGGTGYGDGEDRAYSATLDRYANLRTDRLIATAQATVTQNVYTGGRVQASVNKARSQVFAERANLIAQEQTSFTNAVNAYVGVIEAKDLLDLNINNEQVLRKQLDATNDRFRVGEITRTDVAQAEAALAGAISQREIAQGNLQTAQGTFQQIIGVLPPPDLVEPQPLALPIRDDRDAAATAVANNPNVLAAEFNDSAAKDAIDVAFSQLLPQVSIQGQTFQQNNASIRSTNVNGYQVVAQLSVPLYQGGSEYAAVRQARQSEQQTQRLVDDAKRTAVQNAVNAWDTLVAARAATDSTRSQVRANQIALEGVEREAIVGSRTTLDVLNAEQALLTSRTTLIQNLAQIVTASYQVAAAIGRLTAHDMHLPVALYDDTAYYNAVKDKWAGVGDQATDQPGR